jgi:hypothetical protein
MAGYNRAVSVLQRKRNGNECYDVVEGSTTGHGSNSSFHDDGRVIVSESLGFSRRRKKVEVR